MDAGFVVRQDVLESDVEVGHHGVILLWVEDLDKFGPFWHFGGEGTSSRGLYKSYVVESCLLFLCTESAETVTTLE